MTGGWQKSDLIIIAARPSMGKTAFSLADGDERGDAPAVRRRRRVSSRSR